MALERCCLFAQRPDVNSSTGHLLWNPSCNKSLHARGHSLHVGNPSGMSSDPKLRCSPGDLCLLTPGLTCAVRSSKTSSQQTCSGMSDPHGIVPVDFAPVPAPFPQTRTRVLGNLRGLPSGRAVGSVGGDGLESWCSPDSRRLETSEEEDKVRAGLRGMDAGTRAG